ncbi:MAG TPA: cysteine desulfurase NifS [Ruminococcaceae bacterium]|nr:cysteine desulfurase NifS [Oscillospiraceae bacterium]
MRTIYIDNAATTQMSDTALEAMKPMLQQIYGNPSSLHHIGQIAKEYLDDFRSRIAECINADAREIYFTSGGSEADNQAILTAAYNGAKKGKKHIISSKFEHHAVLHTLDKLKSEGFEIELLDVYKEGIVRVEDVKNALREDTALVTIMMANNEVGTIQPIKEIAQICKEKNVVFHTDAVQAMGHIPVDVKELGVDMLSVSAHKFHGPKGVGFLYCRKGILLQNLINGGAQERGKRAGTENMASIAGMAAALEEACANLKKNAEYVTAIREKIINGVSDIEKCNLNGDRYNRLPGTINLSFEGIEGEGLILLLDQDGICTSSGSACTSGSLDPSHVLLSMGVPVESAHGSLRISLCEYNTEEEADIIIDSIHKVVTYLRSISPVWEKIQNGEVVE